MIRRLLILVVLVALVTVGLPPAHAQTKTYVRVVNMIPGEAQFDVYFSGVLGFSSVEFRFYSNSVEVDPGDYIIELRPAGAAERSEPVGKAEVALIEGQYNAVILAGTAESPTAFAALIDNNTDGRARLNAIHAVPTTPGVDVLAGGTAVITDLTYGNIVSLPADEGIYTLDIVPTGATEPKIGTLKSQAIVSGVVYTVIVGGSAKEPSVLIIADGELLLGAINGSPNTPPVDIYVDGKKLVEGLEYGKFSNLFRLSSKIFRVELRLAGTAADSEPLFVDAIQLQAGIVANLLVTGKLNGQGDEAMVLSAFWGASLQGEGRGGLYIINGIVGSMPISLNVGGNAVVDNVKYRQIGSASGPAGTYEIGITDGDTVKIDLAGYEVQAGKNHFVIVTGTPAKPETIRFFSDPFAVMIKQ